MPWWGDMIVSIVSGIAGSGIITLIAYRNFLKDIPGNTKEEVEKFLKDRINNDTANHNAVMCSLNPSNAQLATDNREIRYKIDQIINGVEVLKDRNQVDYSLLDDAGKHIVHNVEELSKFSLLFEEICKNNLELTQQNQKLSQKIAELEHKNEQLQTQRQGHEQEGCYPDLGLEYR